MIGRALPHHRLSGWLVRASHRTEVEGDGDLVRRLGRGQTKHQTPPAPSRPRLVRFPGPGAITVRLSHQPLRVFSASPVDPAAVAAPGRWSMAWAVFSCEKNVKSVCEKYYNTFLFVCGKYCLTID